jgi:NAD(P)H-hydrate epimerase
MTLERITRLPELAPRRPDSNKGTYGRILVMAGSRGMSGAAVLCASAALRGGAGLVKVATPRDVWPLVAVGNVCSMTMPLDDDEMGRFSPAALTQLLEAAKGSDVVALGPGIGRSPQLTALVSEVVRQVAAPLVLDADGLNACADRSQILEERAGPTVITPHPGEFGRLLRKTVAEVQANREGLALDFAHRHHLVVLLKGHCTLVTDGDQIYVNATGNPGMATAGAGDVLTGLIAALLGQGLSPFAAAQLGAHIHGLAGDLARAELGEEGLVATDLVEYLPRALKQYRASARS